MGCFFAHYRIVKYVNFSGNFGLFKKPLLWYKICHLHLKFKILKILSLKFELNLSYATSLFKLSDLKCS